MGVPNQNRVGGYMRGVVRAQVKNSQVSYEALKAFLVTWVDYFGVLTAYILSVGSSW